MSDSSSGLRAACEQLLQKLVSREGYATLSAPLAIVEIEAFARRQRQEAIEDIIEGARRQYLLTAEMTLFLLARADAEGTK